MEIKAKTIVKVTNVKGMATSGDLSVIGCCVIPYHSQGALKFDLEINFKVFSKFSPPLKKDPFGSFIGFSGFQRVSELRDVQAKETPVNACSSFCR